MFPKKWKSSMWEAKLVKTVHQRFSIKSSKLSVKFLIIHTKGATLFLLRPSFWAYIQQPKTQVLRPIKPQIIRLLVRWWLRIGSLAMSEEFSGSGSGSGPWGCGSFDLAFKTLAFCA